MPPEGHPVDDPTGPVDSCISSILAHFDAMTPDATAIAAPERPPFNYRSLYQQTKATIHALNGMGIGRNDRVAIVLPNGPEMAVCFLSVASGATAAPLNPAYRAEEFDFYLADLGARALITQMEMNTPAVEVAGARGIPVISLEPRPGAEAGRFALDGPGGKRSSEIHGGFAGPTDVALVLHTSGTTARPKIVPLTHANICASAENIRQSLQLTNADRCLNVMPLFHIHGLMGALLSSLAAGASVVCTPGFYAPSFFQWLEEFRPTWYTAVPTIHQGVLARAEANRQIISQVPLRFIRSCSAALPPQLMAAMEDQFQAPVIESYGMTEASHQMTSNPLPPAARKPGSVGVAAGPEVAVMDPAGNLLPVGQKGEIVIRGANVMAGYENNPDANRAAFTNGWFRTGDEGYLDAEGYLFISGRLKEIINRGGEKVSPREVDEVILNHPAVTQAVTFALPDSRLGEDVAAAVVLREGAAASAREIQQFAAERLAYFKVPQQVIFLDEVPKGPTGKIQRIGLAERLGLKSAAAAGPVDPVEYLAPRTATEEQLTQLWQEVLRLERVGVHDNFLHLGGDSLLAAQVLSRVRKVFGIDYSYFSFFEQPIVAAMAGRIDTASRTTQENVSLPLLGPVPKDLAPPLSSVQLRMWYLDQLEPDNPSYNTLLAIRLVGFLNTAALHQALWDIVRRHESLRTNFPERDGQPYQSVRAEWKLDLPVVEVSGVSADEIEREVQRLARQEARRPFDLARGPLLRLLLLRLNEQEQLLLVTVHHIVFDGWSAELFKRELAMFYEAHATGIPAHPPELPIQYADYAAWFQKCLQAGAWNPQLDYWKKHLGGAVPVLQLPTDRPRPAARSFNGARYVLSLPKALAEALKRFSAEHGVTLFMTLLAAFYVLLHRYTQQERIVVGTPIAGRNRVEIEKLIGVFINTLPLSADLSGNPSFAGFLQQVREMALAAYANQDLPLNVLIEALKIKRDSSRTPLFQVLFQLRQLRRRPLEAAGLRFEDVEMERGTSLVDLELDLISRGDSLTCRFTYNTDLFDRPRIERMAANFAVLLESIVEGPARRIGELPLLTAAEQRLLLEEWNNTEADYPLDECIHQLVESQVARSPDTPTLISAGGHLTYAELNRQANRLANHLKKLGIGPDVLVGICMERSDQMVVGLLAILKAGGAYVPLDPAYPRERLAYIVNDSRPPVLITQRALIKHLPDYGGKVLCIDADWDAIVRESGQNVPSEVTPDNLAYVLYTSGSTGNPKGVMVCHRSVCNYLKWRCSYFPLTADDRLLHKTSICFDDSVWELFEPLMVGARVVLPGPGEEYDPAGLVRLMAQQRVTAVTFVPSMLRLLLEEDGIDQCDALRRVTTGGEVLSAELRERFFERLRADLYNGYGPTEATVATTFWNCSDICSHGVVPVGRPIANVKIYLLDEHLQPVPLGAPGEIHIGGVGLARGYLNLPELTAERFIPNPFSDEDGERLYKTGDLGRYLSDGNIEFLGRTDHQVKVRGFRIELEEVEGLLRRHAAVREAAVIAEDDEFAQKRLVAFVVLHPGDANQVGELRQFLREKAPEYMVPSIFSVVDSLPLLPNGKVDREALRRYEIVRPGLEVAFAAPKTPMELLIAESWQELLHLDRVGVYDNFFDLGGYSLLSIQVVARIQQKTGLRISPRELIFQTLGQLAASCDRRLKQQPPVPKQPGFMARCWNVLKRALFYGP